jgi:hypothetical protein
LPVTFHGDVRPTPKRAIVNRFLRDIISKYNAHPISETCQKNLRINAPISSYCATLGRRKLENEGQDESIRQGVLSTSEMRPRLHIRTDADTSVHQLPKNLLFIRFWWIRMIQSDPGSVIIGRNIGGSICFLRQSQGRTIEDRK